jgi:hypothetical protein
MQSQASSRRSSMNNRRMQAAARLVQKISVSGSWAGFAGHPDWLIRRPQALRASFSARIDRVPAARFFAIQETTQLRPQDERWLSSVMRW